MDKTIRLKVKKELSGPQEKSVLQLKGQLISKDYTEIIHISDEGEEYYINSFITLPERKSDAIAFIRAYQQEKDLSEIFEIL
jgi:hypothetical protein